MTTVESWFDATVTAIDELNRADPTSILIAGELGPQELLMGRAAAAWLTRLDPAASPEQLVAARAHHLRRWTRPRSDYPEGRSGYLRWRADAKRVHASELAGIMGAAGAGDASIATATSLILKENLKTSVTAQLHEDALCLTFLEAQLDHTADRLGDDAVTQVLAKTIKKMSDPAVAVALELPLSGHGRGLLLAAASLAATDV